MQARAGITYAPGLVYAPRISSDAPTPSQPLSPAPEEQGPSGTAAVAVADRTMSNDATSPGSTEGWLLLFLV